MDFISEKFNEFSKKQGIREHKNVGGIPQQSGLVEHMNITIFKRVRGVVTKS